MDTFNRSQKGCRKMVARGERWAQLGSLMGSIMFFSAIFRNYFPHQLRAYIRRLTKMLESSLIKKLASFFDPYMKIKFREYSTENLKRSEVYGLIKNYLSANASKQSKMLVAADSVKDGQTLVLSLDDDEEVTDEFEGVKVWWTSKKFVPRTQSSPWYSNQPDEKRYYILTFHESHREFISDSYLTHVLKEGKTIARKKRVRKLYTNNPSQIWSAHRGLKWSHVSFEHPATFDTLAMESKKKEDIINDLVKFSQGKEQYARIGKAWKRGYLLYGPPGTGKSSMIAAMANFLKYDVYDLELTTVKDNTDLRKLLIETSSKSVIVIEDIDCSLNLTHNRKKKNEKKEDGEMKDPSRKKVEEEQSSAVTLSGLLNFIDGLWSACAGERIIVFTTNYVDKLDPALIRRGRMDKHIELSYCCFEAFKVLAKNYLDIDSHDLFETIGRLLGETDMTPADVVENLMPKSDIEDAETCLKNLIEALEKAKEEARKMAEEETRVKEEKEGKEKEQQSAQEDEKGVDEVVSRGVETSAKEVKENGVGNVNGDKIVGEVKENGITT